MTPEEKQKFLKNMVARLMEHFETVNITCTTRMPNGDYSGITWGDGNWYARYGSVCEWLKGAEGELGGAGTVVMFPEMPPDESNPTGV